MLTEYKKVSLRGFPEPTVWTCEIADCVEIRNSNEKGAVSKSFRIRQEYMKSQRYIIQGFIF